MQLKVMQMCMSFCAAEYITLKAQMLPCELSTGQRI